MNFGVYPFQKLQHLVRIAEAEARLVVTFDKDLGELAVRSRVPASGGVVLFGCTARVATTGPGTLRSSPPTAFGCDGCRVRASLKRA